MLFKSKFNPHRYERKNDGGDWATSKRQTTEYDFKLELEKPF